MDYAVKARLFWWDTDQSPADKVLKSGVEARDWAIERSKMVQGKVELSAGPNRPPFAVYKNGEMIEMHDEYRPEVLMGSQHTLPLDETGVEA